MTKYQKQMKEEKEMPNLLGRIYSNYLQYLYHKRDKRINRYWKNRAKKIIILFLSSLVILIASSIFYHLKSIFGFAIAILVALYMFIYALAIPLRLFQRQIDKIDSEIDFIRAQKLGVNERAEQTFRYHQSELQKYYNQTLDHSKGIFKVGIICIIIGFMIIGFTLFFLISSETIFKFKDNNAESVRVITSIFSGIGAILSNFIGVIYLKMYSETIKSLSTFHSRLVTTHHLHLANCLNSKIDDSDLKLRNKTFSDMAKEIVKSAHLEELSEKKSNTHIQEKEKPFNNK